MHNHRYCISICRVRMHGIYEFSEWKYAPQKAHTKSTHTKRVANPSWSRSFFSATLDNSFFGAIFTTCTRCEDFSNLINENRINFPFIPIFFHLHSVLWLLASSPVLFFRGFLRIANCNLSKKMRSHWKRNIHQNGFLDVDRRIIKIRF